jgi:glycyl-tRNA synthetase beta chain
VRRGNEWVVSGRLEDAEFFYREDRKRSLADWARELEQVTYHAGLGSYAAKARRLERLADLLGVRLGEEEETRAAARRAAALAKTDLVTGMVGEFPELQGVVGSLYAAEDGEPPAVARSIGDHYRPQGPEDRVPPPGAPALVALADRVDALVGCFGAGVRPTGSRDPFGLRRAALGALRLLLENRVELDLAEVLDEAAGGFGVATESPSLPEGWQGAPRSELHAFLEERLAFLLGEAGARYDEVAAAAAATGAGLDPLDRRARVEALRGIRGDEDFLALAAAAKRIRNILVQARESGEEPAPVLDEAELEEPAERELLRAAREAGARAGADLREKRYGPALRGIAALRAPVDDFFEKVLVMDPEAGRRARRLALLDRVGELLHSVIDFSQIVVEGEEAARDAAPDPGRMKNG